MDPSKNVASLQSFNGMVNYLKKFSPVLSELSEPLRRLCKSGVEWAWESEQQNAFEAIKQVIMTLPVLAYFDRTNASFTVSDFLVASAIFLGKITTTAEKSLWHYGFCTHFVAAIFTVTVADCE